MLGSKTGKRDIDRGIANAQKGITDIRAAFTKDPHRQIALLEEQRDRHLTDARNYREKARGLFNGPARLRMAEAAEASAEKAQAKADALRAKHGITSEE